MTSCTAANSGTGNTTAYHNHLFPPSVTNTAKGSPNAKINPSTQGYKPSSGWQFERTQSTAPQYSLATAGCTHRKSRGWNEKYSNNRAVWNATEGFRDTYVDVNIRIGTWVHGVGRYRTRSEFPL